MPRVRQGGLKLGVALAVVASLPGAWWLWDRWSHPAPPALGISTGPSNAQETALRREADQSPGDPLPQLRLGRLLVERGRPSQAVPPLRLACGHPSTAGSAAVLLAQVATTPAVAGDVLPDAQKAVALAPKDPRTWEGLIRILFAQGQSGPATAALNEALRLFPAAPRLRFISAEAAANRGDARTAVTIYEKALRELPDPHAYLMLGLLHARSRSTKRAREAFLQAVALDPTSLTAHLGLAKAALELGLTDEAERTAYTVLQLAPTDPEAILMLGRVLLQKGDPASQRTARELLERTVRIAPANMDAYFYLGQVKLRAGDAKGAVRAFEEVVSRRPERMDARQAYSRALRQAGDLKNAEIQANLVNQITELEQLRVHLTTRVSHSPKDAAARCDLADFYLKNNAVPMAVRQYQKALELDPGNARAAEGLRRAGSAAP